MELLDFFNVNIIVPGQLYSGIYQHKFVNNEGKIYLGVSNIRRTESGVLVYSLYILTLFDNKWHFDCERLNLIIKKDRMVNFIEDLFSSNDLIGVKEIKYIGNFGPDLSIDTFRSKVMKEKERLTITHSFTYLSLALLIFVYSCITRLVG